MLTTPPNPALTLPKHNFDQLPLAFTPFGLPLAHVGSSRAEQCGPTVLGLVRRRHNRDRHALLGTALTSLAVGGVNILLARRWDKGSPIPGCNRLGGNRLRWPCRSPHCSHPWSHVDLDMGAVSIAALVADRTRRNGDALDRCCRDTPRLYGHRRRQGPDRRWRFRPDRSRAACNPYRLACACPAVITAA